MEENLKQQHTSALKIALVGPECSGKTTIAEQLAHYFETIFVPEYARDYLQNKWDSQNKICEPTDLLPIAIGQIQLENEALVTAKNLVICDTSSVVTEAFSKVYYGFSAPEIEKAARKHKYDLYILTDLDVPWVKDDLRDGLSKRQLIFTSIHQSLIQNNKAFIIISGDEKTRFEKSKFTIESLIRSKKLGFSSNDFIQVLEKGIPIEAIEKQLRAFQNGIPKTILVKPAQKNDGILKIEETKFQEYATYFDANKQHFKLKKFVPASGAASRMFKFLSEFLNDYDPENETINAYTNRKNASQLNVFLTGLEKFPFFKIINSQLKKQFPDFNSWDKNQKNYQFIKLLLDSNYFNFSNKPKGILPFHKYVSHTATPIEEHLNECTLYASSNRESNLHLTISEIHQGLFEKIIATEKSKIEENTQTKININYSFQNSTTDSLAVNNDNTPFRNENGKLVFRPAGHGALIENLNALDADIIFIKNIDNVVQNQLEKTVLYKKALAGILIELQKKVFDILFQIDKNKIQVLEIENIILFMEQKLNIVIIEDFFKYTLKNQIIYIKELLHRPIRVCGMVKNEGEPGGGPFWIRDENGAISLQIIESAQIDSTNPKQAQIAADATYFNPVDLICGIKDYKGVGFDLSLFTDPTAGFIVEKNKNGKPLKAYELPGLWNGAMAKWISVFVEVPLLTFNPVKIVNDLLKSAHQPN